MKASEVHSLTIQELTLKETNLRQELQQTRFQKHTGELADTAKLSRLKKDLARVLTEMRARPETAGENKQEA